MGRFICIKSHWIYAYFCVCAFTAGRSCLGVGFSQDVSREKALTLIFVCVLFMRKLLDLTLPDLLGETNCNLAFYGYGKEY